MRLGVGGDPLAAAVGHACCCLQKEQALLGGCGRHSSAPRLLEEMVVVFVGLEAEERQLKAVLTPAGLGMAGPHVAAGLREDRHDVGREAHRPIGGNDRGSVGRWDQGEVDRGGKRSEASASPAGEGPAKGGKATTNDRLPVSRFPSLRFHDRVPWREPGRLGRGENPPRVDIPRENPTFSQAHGPLGLLPSLPIGSLDLNGGVRDPEGTMSAVGGLRVRPSSRPADSANPHPAPHPVTVSPIRRQGCASDLISLGMMPTVRNVLSQ